VGPEYPAVIATAIKLHDEGWVGGVLGGDFSVPMDDATRADVAWFAAKHHFASESWGLTLGLLPLVPEDSRFGVDAKILRAITLTQQGRYETALEELVSARDRASGRDVHFRNVLDLNIARTFYALGNWGRAMEYYGRVQRGDSAWPEAQFERAWAHFRADDMAGTVALLLTHDSPFFEGWYFPEGDLLRAQALFLMCKFPATTQAIDAFQASYTPVLSQLRTALTSLDAKAAVADGQASLTGATTKLPASLLRRLSGDERFLGAMEGIAAAKADLEKLQRLGQPWSARVAALVDARHAARVTEEGDRILAHARDAEDDLDDMLKGIEMTRIDLLSFEADMYQRAANTGELPDIGDPLGTLRKEQRKKNKRLWPFEGEYWADELGWYKVTARPECPAGMARGGT
jgi:tetratricopeptide (TPR) repeat protein